MPSDDLILDLRQIAGYPSASFAQPTDAIVIQRGGLGGPYLEISPPELVSSALSQGGDLNVGGQLRAASVQAGSATFSNAAVGMLSAQKACLQNVALSIGTIAGVPIASTNYVDMGIAGVKASSVWSFNGRVGDVKLWLQDILQAGGAPVWSPFLQGTPMATTPSLRSNSDRIATTAFVHQASANAVNCLLQNHPFVFTFNGRSGDVVLTPEDIAGADAAFTDSPAFTGTPTAPTAPPLTNNSQIATTQYVDNAVTANNTALGQIYAPLNSPAFTGMPTALTAPPGTSTGVLATTAFVMNAITNATAGVASFNGRTGAVDLEPIDLQDAGGALINSPAFTGVPTAPTAALNTNTSQLATCAFVMAELGGSNLGVVSFNGRDGAVVLNTSDITAAGGAPLASPALSGTPTAPTAAPGTSTNQIATCAFVEAAAASGGVSSFNGRTGAVTLTFADVSAAGGLANPSPNLTGTPTAPTAATATSTTQIATTAFVYAALAAGTVTTFNTRSGAVTLTQADIVNAGGAILASPAFSGVPTAPTAPANTNSTQLATCAFVAAAIGAYLPLTGGTLTGTLVAPVVNVSNGQIIVFKGTAANPTLYFNDGTLNRSSLFYNIGAAATQINDNTSGSSIQLLSGGGISLNPTGAGSVNVTGNQSVSGVLIMAGGGQLQGSGGVISSTATFQAPNLQFSNYLMNAGGQPVTLNIANMNIVTSAASPSGLAFSCTDGAASVGYFIWVDSGSDARIKRNIKPTSVDALAAILAIQVREFDFDPAASDALRNSKTPRHASFYHVPIGLVAQEVAGIIPDMDFVATQPAGHNPALPTDLHAIVLPNAIPHLIRAMQQLEARVRQLETRTLQ